MTEIDEILINLHANVVEPDRAKEQIRNILFPGGENTENTDDGFWHAWDEIKRDLQYE